ncbi:MAG: LysR family transcriptional regulator [Parafannyhessea sp.]|uniref:LysR family transcriptional regulator n=1 Tax=Parafannyhessea sp. TaxID=2847324 RepID=UPI003EFCE45E
MKLQQLRYVIQVAESGSLTAAAQRLYIAQPSLSKAVSELEREMGITIFTRSRTGVELTEEGTRFLSYARQVVEQADLLESEYKGGAHVRRVFGVSAQHYAFVVNAFVQLVREHDANRYEFSLRETSTAGIIDDVRVQRSELGILYRSHFNRDVITNAIRAAGLAFEPLFTAAPHVFVSRDNPLAERASVTLEDLLPYPRLSYDQGIHNSPYFAEELHITEPAEKSIVVTDRATLFNLLIGLGGYTISSGILSEALNGSQIVSVPLQSDEVMELGYVRRGDRPLSPIASRYLTLLQDYVSTYRKGDHS